MKVRCSYTRRHEVLVSESFLPNFGARVMQKKLLFLGDPRLLFFNRKNSRCVSLWGIGFDPRLDRRDGHVLLTIIPGQLHIKYLPEFNAELTYSNSKSSSATYFFKVL